MSFFKIKEIFSIFLAFVVPPALRPQYSAFCSIFYFIIWQGKSERSDWFFLGRDFAIRTVTVETVISCVFLFSKAGKFKTSMARVPYNKLLTNLASSSRTGEYWPSVVFVQTSLRSVRTATTSGQYSPVRPSRSVSKRLVFSYCSFLFFSTSESCSRNGSSIFLSSNVLSRVVIVFSISSAWSALSFFLCFA